MCVSVCNEKQKENKTKGEMRECETWNETNPKGITKKNNRDRITAEEIDETWKKRLILDDNEWEIIIKECFEDAMWY